MKIYNHEYHKIETATIADAGEILALQKLAFQSEAELYGDFTIDPLTQTIEDISEEFKTRTVLKCVADGRIVGSVRAHEIDGTCLIGRLIVHPEYQNQGLGTRLMQEIESRFPKARRFEIFTGTKSLHNIRLYEKLGYKECGQQIVNERLTLVRMDKTQSSYLI